MRFDNRFLRSFPGEDNPSRTPRQVFGALYTRTPTTPVAAPRLLAEASEVKTMLGLQAEDFARPPWLDVLAGNALLPGMETYATAYGGHQFGHWAGQLGDGRALMLGEIVAPDDTHYELQLKGAGPTPFSRGADGRAVLRSSIREFLCSEAMHHLGVPTTRALALVATGEEVERDMFYDGHPELEPGAIVCRVAPSFLRFGHCQLLAARGEIKLLRELIDYVIQHYEPAIDAQAPQRLERWFMLLCERTAELIAAWMTQGFVHGVMNTDNMSLLGLTIDYGPYGWVDDFDPSWTPNTTDAEGRRYCYGRQPAIAQWNLARLGEALLRLEIPVSAIEAGLARYAEAYGEATRQRYTAKLGLSQWSPEAGDVLDGLFALLTAHRLDMTLFFRDLARADTAEDLRHTFYSEESWQQGQAPLAAWLHRYRGLLAVEGLKSSERLAVMNRANPRYVLRNYLAQQAIDAAQAGDLEPLHTLMEVLRHPYEEQAGREAFAAKRPEWARHKAGCSMLSCSS